MVRSTRSKGVLSAPFGLCFFLFAGMPTAVGYQDIASLVARQPAVTGHWNQHFRASAFGTIHAATFNFSRPVGTYMPQPLSVTLASLDPSLITLPPWDVPVQAVDDPPLPYPQVDRNAKGDRQAVLHPPERKPDVEAPVAAAPESQPAVVAEAKAEPAE